MAPSRPPADPAIPVRPAVVIAAGGEGTRIGGNKPGRVLAGRTLLDHAISWARTQTDLVALAVRSGAEIDADGLPVLTDRDPGIGPISALASAFRFAIDHQRSHVALIGCDLPFLPPDMIARLCARIGDRGAAMPASAGRHQPMATLWRADEEPLVRFMAGGGRSLWRFAATVGVEEVEWATGETGDPFLNINDPQALEEAEARFTGKVR